MTSERGIEAATRIPEQGELPFADPAAVVDPICLYVSRLEDRWRDLRWTDEPERGIENG